MIPAFYIPPLPHISLPTIPSLTVDEVMEISVFGVPMLTIGLIGITSVVLAYVTIHEGKSDTAQSASPQIESTPSPYSGGSRKSRHKKNKSRRSHPKK